MKKKEIAQTKIKSDIVSISRLRMGTDGQGVSTLVALYGCPLNCAYCINRECHAEEPYYINGVEYPALETVPRATYTPEELIEILEKDELYYLMTNGGIIFGGGEPLLQPDFIHQVCELANPDWNIRIETSLNVPWENIEMLLKDVDEWIIDIKDMNDEIYERYTGTNNKQVKDNLLKLKEYLQPDQLRIRVPRISRFNTEEDVQYSYNWILRYMGVLPEVFEYIVLRNTKRAQE